jgi:hypothetical protein
VVGVAVGAVDGPAKQGLNVPHAPPPSAGCFAFDPLVPATAASSLDCSDKSTSQK